MVTLPTNKNEKHYEEPDIGSSSCAPDSKERSQHFAPIDALMPLFREQLAAGKCVKFSPRGVSMLPMLRQGIDSVVISPVPDRLKRYDLPLYQRDNGAYVLHRVVEVAKVPVDSTQTPVYTCMGDNQFAPEPGLRHDQMIAVVTAFYRGDKRHEVNELGYRAYCRLWYRTRGARRFARRCVNFARRCLGFIRRKLR